MTVHTKLTYSKPKPKDNIIIIIMFLYSATKSLLALMNTAQDFARK